MTVKKFKPQIVHESATQRQHIRVDLPARAEIYGKTYGVGNLSVGGMALIGFDGDVDLNSPLPVKIHFPFDGFDFSISVMSEVRYYDPGGTVTGLQFVQMSRAHLSLLRFVVDALITGEIVDAGELFAIAQRENFTASRDSGAVVNEEPGFGQFIRSARRRVGALGFLILATGLLAFIVANVLTRMFVVQADGAVVSAQMVVVRAPQSAALVSHSVPLGARVQRNSPIASLQGPNGQVINIVSHCDCVVSWQFADEGAFVRKGSPVAQLVPATGANQALVTVALKDLRRVRVGDAVEVTFYDRSTTSVGRIEQVSPPNLSGSSLNGAAPRGSDAVGQVLVRLASTIPATQVGQPISARIRVSKLDLFA